MVPNSVTFRGHSADLLFMGRSVGMKYIALYFFLTIAGAAYADGPSRLGSASAEVAPLLAEMGAAANAHDVERHVGFYAHNPSVIFIFNAEAIVGWESIRDKQREVWRNGKSDVVYTVQGLPDFREPAPGLVLTTMFMKSRAQCLTAK
jgi:hypothetical protein